MSERQDLPILEVKDLCMQFTDKGRKKKIVNAVDHVSFTVNKGETFGLVGESGCGKTTTGRCIMRLYDPASGEIYYDGQPIHGKMTKQKRKYLTDNIAMVFQDPMASLNPRMTVEEIIGEGLEIKEKLDAKQRHDIVVQMLTRVGLSPEHATRYPHEFSGGQRQRIGIARALAVNPGLIVADEPLSALDVSVQAQVINLLNKLKEEMGLTILFIAHNLSVMKYFSDRVGVMYFGRLVEVADADKLFSKPAHPYTRALLSAAPQPDPHMERQRKKIIYDPSIHQYGPGNEPSYHTLEPGHVIYCSDREFAQLQETWI